MIHMKKIISIVTAVAIAGTLSFPAASFAAAETQLEKVDGDKNYVEGEVLVTFKDNVSEKKAVAIAEDITKCDATVVDTACDATTVVAETDGNKDVKSLIRKYEKDPDVVYAQPNYLYEPDTTNDVTPGEVTPEKTTTEPAKSFPTNDPLYSTQWQIDKIDADDAWKFINQRYPNNEKVKVALLDMGTNLDHEDLKGNILRNNSVSVPLDLTTGAPPPANRPGSFDDLDKIELKPYTEPLQFHGTITAGVIAADSNNGKGLAGMTNNLAELMSINIFRYRDGAEDNRRLATSEDIARCIKYAADNGAKVISMSIGNTIGSQSATNDLLLEQTIDTVVKGNNKDGKPYNVTVVTSAGNQGRDDYPWYPSDFTNTISVISTDNYKSAYDVCKSDFSSYGAKKTLSAPGNKIPTTRWDKDDNTYNPSSGTSLAAPVVASVAALMYYVNPNLTATQARDILCNTATDLYTTGPDAYTGYGNVNAYSAVAKAAGIEVNNEPAPLNTPAISSVSSQGLGRMTVTWNAVPNTEEYYLYRSTSPSGTYDYVGRTANTSYTNGNLKYNQRYYYKVKATGTVDNKKARSELSSYRSNYPNGKVTSLSASSYSYKSVRLSWKRVQDAAGYKIYRATSKKGKYKQVKRLTKGSTTAWRDTKNSPGKRYYYKIRAYKTGVNGPVSGIVSAKAVPAKVTLSSVRKYNSRATKVSWKGVTSATGYKVYRATSKSGRYKLVSTKKSSSRSYINRSLKKGKRYYYKVRAYKKVGRKTYYGSYSTVKNVKL